MRLGEWKPVVAGWPWVLVGVALLSTDARPGQTAPEATRSSRPQAASRSDVEIPAPRPVTIAAGYGKARVYELDQKGERIADPRKGVVGRFREVEREFRWAVVAGVVDERRTWASLNWDRPIDRILAENIYRGVDLERQVRQKDGAWSDWHPVDRKATLSILDHLPSVERERVSREFLAGPLVDPLPWLVDHDWKGVDVEEFLPPERRNRADRRSAPDPAPPPHRAAPPRLMFRALDLTVEPGRTYRYRVRVAFNLRKMPGASRRESSAWSEATDVVTIPRPDGGP
jgi:hypothetical protein